MCRPEASPPAIRQKISFPDDAVRELWISNVASLISEVLNVARVALAAAHSDTADSSPRVIGARLSLYGRLALVSGVAWSFLAVLSDGYTTPQAPLYLIVLAGTSAGSVTYSPSYARTSINF